MSYDVNKALSVCPFCGDPPVVAEGLGCKDGKSYNAVCCINDDCTMNPNTEFYKPISYNTVACAIYIWECGLYMPFLEWPKKPQKTTTKRTCPNCGDRSTKIVSIDSGLIRCQQCRCEYKFPLEEGFHEHYTM